MTGAIDAAELKGLLRYDPDTGFLFWLERPRELFGRDREWKRWNTRYAGKRAFSLNDHGYRDGMIFRRMYRAHQVAWALMHGSWPTGQIDHINGDRDDNRWVNLRDVTRSENCRNSRMRSNNTTGVMGIAPHHNKWRAFIRAEGRQIHLGLFGTKEAAAEARKDAERKYGFHPNHGRAAA